MKSISFCVAFLVLITGACGSRDQVDIPDTIRRDSAGVELIELDGSLLDNLPVWTLSSEPVLSIGGIAAEGPSAINRVAGAVRFANGILAIADQSQEVRYFASDGSFLKQVGGRGEGPGEFSRISFLAYHEDGLLVMDAGLGRATVLDSDGAVVDTYLLPVQQCALRLSHGIGYRCVPNGAFSDGTIVTAQELGGPMPTSVDESVTPGLLSFIGVMTRDSYLEIDTLQQATQVVYRAHDIPSAGRRPFDSQGVYAVGREHIALGSGDRFEIRFRDRLGTLIRILRVAQARRIVSRQDLEPYGAEEHFKVLLDVAGAADSVPHFSTLRLDDVDRLWVQEYVPVATTEPGATWIVFDQGGIPVARIRFPRMMPLQIGSDFVLTRRIGDLGTESVDLYSIEPN